MDARRYGIYLPVFTSISNERAKRTSEISNVNTRRKISNLQASMYYSVYYTNILIAMFLTTFRRFPKIFQNCSEGLTNISEHFPNIFRRYPKIAEGSQIFPRKYR